MVKPVILSLKFKAPFEEVHEKGEFASKYENLIIYDNKYYSNYVLDNLKNAEIVKLTNYIGVSTNPPKLEDLSDIEAVEYYADLLVYADILSTKEQVFETLVLVLNKK